MEDLRYRLSQLFKLAFGVTSPVFIPYSLNPETPGQALYKSSEAVNSGSAEYNATQGKAQPISNRLSWMGTPVVFPWTLKGGTYKRFDPSGELVDVSMEDFEMPAATLVEFELDKVMTRTRVSANAGTVKELYGFDDWALEVRGICLTDNSRKSAKTAAEQKQQLIAWARLCSSPKVVGDLFFEKDIMALTLGKIKFTQLEGKPDVIPFQFQAFSDERLEMVL